jgi:ubiquinone/menaquinone biosynthesis C-methylase UbiE
MEAKPTMGGLRERFWARVRADHLRQAEIIFRHYAPHLSGTVLDFGCGDGSFLEYLRQHTELGVLGVDVAGNSWYDLPMIVYDGASIPLADEAVECSTANFVLHHTPDPEAALAEMVRVSRRRVLLLEDLWFNRRQKFSLYFNHVVFDAFMVAVSAVSSFEWKTNFRYTFRTDEEWRAIFERVGVRLLEHHDVTIVPNYPVPHRVYVLERR